MTGEVVVARYGELWLKGRNRGDFERRLLRNCQRALQPIANCEIERQNAQLVVVPDKRAADVTRRLTEVFGFSSVSPARRSPREAEAIAETARTVLGEALDSLPRNVVVPFRVETRRGDKSFPMISTELDRFVAERVLPEHADRLRVDLSNPELTLGITVRHDGAFVYAERLPGAGGLPVGTLGRVASLLSGGIDSPVASWMAMKRGCEVVYVAFHSYPFIGESYQAKVRKIVRKLARFQDRSILYEVPFARIQTEIKEHCPESYRTVLYRRMMQRIAARVAEREKASALVTGESLGQVASQTLENLTAIGAATKMPVLRPLVAFDKSETIDVARRIGTYDISILPEPDCCTVFQPRRPVIRGSLAVCEDAESGLEIDALVSAACEEAERLELDPA